MPWKGLRPNPAGGRKAKQQIAREKSDDPARLSSSTENTGDKPKKSTTPSDNAPDDHATALPPCPSPLPFDRPGEGLTHSLKNREVPGLFQRRTGMTAPRTHRFSLLRSRHASDPQLSKSYAAAAPTLTPPLPSAPAPTIITTAPISSSSFKSPKIKDRLKPESRSQNPSSEDVALSRQTVLASLDGASQSCMGLNSMESRDRAINKAHVSFEEPNRLTALPSVRGLPPAYGEFPTPSLTLPPSRLSESSRSDASSSSPRIYAETTTTHTVSTTTTFFRLPRRKKDRGHLFPLPVKIPPPDVSRDELKTPTSAPFGRASMSPGRGTPQAREPVTALFAPERRPDSASGNPSPLPSPTHSAVALTNAPLSSSSLSLFRRNSVASHRSAKSTPSVPMPPSKLGSRDRSSTFSSDKKGRGPEGQMSPQFGPSSRTSTSTSGRKSFGDIFSLSSKFRQNSEPTGKSLQVTPGTPASIGSKQNSFQIPREPTYPERVEGDTPATYLIKLEQAVSRGVMAAILCKGSDEFFKTCLRKYMRGFSYFGDSIDMSVRKMLMEVELPKETQQIDRLLAGFADRYCECNPGIFVSTDEAYFVAFSILLLHSDTHNKNNKRKMQKQDYVKNTQGQVEVSRDILECFYDNVSYTPFIHFEDEVAINSHRLAAPKPKKGIFKAPSTDNLRGPVDPYALILEQKLEVLRPSLKEVMNTEDTYSYTGTVSMDSDKLQLAFHKASVLQIVSARSRPDAFLSQATISNPAEAQAGLVDIKAAKVGLVWRKDPRKKKTRSPWQEWGVILTTSQLYFFRDLTWVKGLMTQFEARQRLGMGAAPVVFKPPLADFKPEDQLSMEDAVALLDTGYKKHKHAFLFVKHGGFEETFLANNEADMNDWIAKINYAATFRTTGVRTRGFLGANYEGQRPHLRRRSSSSDSVHSANDEKAIDGGQINQQLAGEILAYRKQIMIEKIHEANEKLDLAQKELDNLLRNARHLQTCSPIQQKSREALVLAAGRMSAKLKWTRVDMWKTKCHRDVLKMDLEQVIGRSSVASILREPSSLKSIAQRQTSLRLNNSTTEMVGTTVNDMATSPKSAHSRISTHSLAVPLTDRAKAVESVSTSSDGGPAARPPSVIESVDGTVAEILQEIKEKPRSVSIRSHHTAPLNHRPSIGSSRFARSDADSIGHGSRLTTATPTMDDEERVLRDAGLVDSEQTPKAVRRPETSDSNREFPTMTGQDSLSKDRSSVRRSLQRTLRDSEHSPRTGQSLRHRKGRESVAQTSPAQLRRDSQTRSEGLTRSPGSFTVHGKKASVVTFGSEWQSMSSDERPRLRMQTPNDDNEESDDGQVVTILSPKMEEDEGEEENVAAVTAHISKADGISREEDDDEVEEDAKDGDGADDASQTDDQLPRPESSTTLESVQLRTGSRSGSMHHSSDVQLGDRLMVASSELRRSPSPQAVQA